MLPTLLFLCIVLPLSAQLLELNEGKVQGFDYQTEKNTFTEVFLNIPYASPPVNDLRFQKPKPPAKWHNVRDGTKFGSACIHIVPEAVAPSLQTSEDCLTLNIIRPKGKAPLTGFPILVFVHGGAFETGSAQEYGYKGFAEIYNTKYVIVVTIQYRLGIYGFFSTGDERLKGNLGLYDMAEALKFIHSNAKNFAGDPKQITVWGYGAGAAAAGQLALSPLSREYVTRTIEMSGSPWASWALGASVVTNSLQLAKELKCDRNIKKCLKESSVEKIYAAIKKVGATSDGLRYLKWGPVIDGIFLQHPDEMAVLAPPKVSIIGVTNNEAASFTLLQKPPFIHKLGIDSSEFAKWNREKFVDEIEKLVKQVYVGDQMQEVIDEIVTQYTREEEKTSEFYIKSYNDLLSDLLFNVPAADGIFARRKTRWDVFAYVLDYHNEAVWSSEVPRGMRGVPHGSDLSYVTGTQLPEKFDEKEKRVLNLLQEAFAVFAREGGPYNHEKLWLEISSAPTLRYLEISSNSTQKWGFCHVPYSFWNRIRKYGFDMVQTLPVKTNKETHFKDEL